MGYLQSSGRSSADIKKLPNQVVDAVNVNLDPAFGITKRFGSKFNRVLGPISEYKDGKWFFYRRDEDEYYLGIINKGSIRLFNTITGVEATVTAQGNALDYLSSDNFNDYRTLTIQDNTIVVNRSTVIQEAAAPTYAPNQVATVALRYL